MCYAFFEFGGAMPNGVLWNTLLAVPWFADEHLKRAYWDFFSRNWAYLDDTTRRWIAGTPVLWKQILESDRQGANLNPFEWKRLLDYYGRNFEWFEAELRRRHAQ
jgi:hypothetical protein